MDVNNGILILILSEIMQYEFKTNKFRTDSNYGSKILGSKKRNFFPGCLHNQSGFIKRRSETGENSKEKNKTVSIIAVVIVIL
jgi:hypothetical protein